MDSRIYIGADHNVRITGLRDADTDAYLNAATVSFVLEDSAGTAITGGSGSASYVGASNGNYLGILDSAATAILTEGVDYFLEVTIDEGNYEDFRRFRLTATYRGEY